MSDCRFCGTILSRTFVDLGMQPPSNAFVKPENANKADRFYPLHAYVCDECKLVQLEEFESPTEIFREYPYFSSGSQAWLTHAKTYAERMIKRFGLSKSSRVVEVASNDGYLLRNFQRNGITVLGIEPAANVAEMAQLAGVPTEVAFFGSKVAMSAVDCGYAADLMPANNVLCHVPDINDFVDGFRILLKPKGVATFEFPSLLKLIDQCQFDTIYHEHFSYLSFLTAERIFQAHGLKVFDVEELPTHGGSLRLYVTHEIAFHVTTPAVETMRRRELAAGLDDLSIYDRFAQLVVNKKYEILNFFLYARRRRRSVVGYGAAAKGNTLLNYCGIGPKFMPFVVDSTPYKQGLLLPGTHIPIKTPDAIVEYRPNYVFILPWNWKDEIIAKEFRVREWGGKFVTAIPDLVIE